MGWAPSCWNARPRPGPAWVVGLVLAGPVIGGTPCLDLDESDDRRFTLSVDLDPNTDLAIVVSGYEGGQCSGTPQWSGMALGIQAVIARVVDGAGREREAGTGGNQTAHDNVLLEATQVVLSALHGGFRQHSGGLLEGGRGDEALGRQVQLPAHIVKIRAKCAAVDAHILAEEKDPGIPFHGQIHGLADRLADRGGGVVVEVDAALGPGPHAVEKIEKSNGRLAVVCPRLKLEADLVLVAIGVTPASELAVAAGLQTSVDGAIAVDARQRTSNKAIYAAGDCADAFHVVTGQRTWIPLALRANRAGWAVADNVCGIDRRLAGVVGSAVFKVFDLQVARTGLNEAEARKAGLEPAAVVIKSRSRAHAHPGASDIWVYMVGDRGSGRLLGVQMVGRDGVAHRLHAPAVALHGHMTVEQFSQMDLAYAPPFGPTWDPMLTAANQLLKKIFHVCPGNRLDPIKITRPSGRVISFRICGFLLL